MTTIRYSRRLKGKNGVGGTSRAVACGLAVQDVSGRGYPGDDPDVVEIWPLNTQNGGSGVFIRIPKENVPELIQALNRMIAGPLGLLALDAEKSHVER